jgi:hypothetical protein
MFKVIFPQIRTLIGLFCLSFLSITSFQALKMAWAQSMLQHNTLDSVKLAVQLAPGNAAYHALLAEHLESSGKSPEGELRAAVRLDPFDARYLNRLGFWAEVAQDNATAEQVLLRAAQVDRGFRPRWALMNYYFRGGNDDQFWRWTRESLQRSYGDLTPIFRLCWAQTADAAFIERQLPNDSWFRLRYLEFLNAEEPPAAAQRIAPRVASDMNPGDDPDAPVTYCNRVIGQNTPSALAVWNTLCARKVLPWRALHPASGDVVTNGSFESPNLAKGFDWRIRRFDGLRTTLGPDTGLILTFDGSQPEIFDVLEQPIPLARFHRYEMLVEYQLRPSDESSGLRWHLDLPDSSVLAEGSVLGGSGIQQQKLTFFSGAADLAALHLTFRRTPGSVRWSGTAAINHVAIKPVAVPGLPFTENDLK